MSIALHDSTEKAIKTYATKRGIPAPEAADKLIGTALSRLGALAKYAQSQVGKTKKGKKGKKLAKLKVA